MVKYLDLELHFGTQKPTSEWPEGPGGPRYQALGDGPPAAFCGIPGLGAPQVCADCQFTYCVPELFNFSESQFPHPLTAEIIITAGIYRVLTRHQTAWPLIAKLRPRRWQLPNEEAQRGWAICPVPQPEEGGHLRVSL